ncbi:prolyl aminopeptidase [Alloalcanivorax gelatiniphagus]|uniref:Proline iminopeptidase n=1 Tax=Alloalcanivorax gelatiniphagus TaxID=1194167 RepID=A0ABY2XJ02_9GAMM|nr:prolyl aminopeptidase [Alloalcanivorax gelatiniphagus]TMW11871.1 prolyl aminopeptidase [Alloalcanivorax gelatiniphagus]|tara:strand:- start:7065 stop:8036 length:972 start_codon:yes stop_codon:yes gene_type:complete
MSLFPPLEPYHREFLDVGNGHRLYVEESGNPDGVPVVALHGGPGGGSSPLLRRLFDPHRFRIVVYDQRGAGRSEPYAGTDHNTLPDLVDDIERIREHLKVPRWEVVLGGSWGVTLALAYALAYPAAVAGLVLRGVFLCRRQDIDWLYTEGGAGRFYPDHWHRLLSALPDGEGDLLTRYHRALDGPDGEQLAREWTLWEARLSSLTPPPELNVDHNAGAMAKLETHYFVNDGFLDEPILPRAHRIQCPVEIVHGRYDMVCPPEQAWLLHRALPDSRLHWVAAAGHSSAEPGISQALVRAVKALTARAARAAEGNRSGRYTQGSS